MSGFKAAMLLANAIKASDILRSGIFLTQSPTLELLAGLDFVKELNHSFSKIKSTKNYTALHEELRRYNSKDEDSLHSEEHERATLIASELHEFTQEYSILSTSYFNLLAIELLVRNFERADISDQLQEADWLVKHEILARWGWMKSEKHFIAQGGPIEHPFRCRVESRNRDRQARIIGREFYALILFLHQLKARQGTELLFIKKGETPDFVLEDAAGEEMGAEMSEVPHSEEWAKEMDAESLIFDCLQEIAGNLPFNITIQGQTFRNQPCFWRKLAEGADDLKSWLKPEIRHITSNSGIIHLANQTLGIHLKVEVREGDGGLLTWTHDIHGEASLDDAANEKEVSDSIYLRLRNKIFKRMTNGTERYRRTPSVRPCHLVLYPNASHFGLDYNSIASRVRGRIDFDPSTHFDHIWLSSEGMLMPIYNGGVTSIDA